MSKVTTYKIADLPAHSDATVDVRALRCQRAMVTFVTMRPTGTAYLHPPHRHPFEQMLIISEGAMVLKIGAEEYPVAAGSSIIIPANEWHTARADGGKPVTYMEVLAPARQDWVHLTTTQTETYEDGDVVSWFETEADKALVE